MAFVDEKDWVLNFIRTQFVLGDDTGFCEAFLGSHCDLPSRDDDDVLAQGARQRAHSPDITLNMDAKSRRRSNTAMRLERIRKEREEKSKIQISRWNSQQNDSRSRAKSQESGSSSDFTPADTELSTQIVAMGNSAAPKKKSALTMQLQRVENGALMTPFVEYAKFDGRSGKLVQARFLKVIMHHQKHETFSDKDRILPVCVSSNARVMDVIGLACWQYTMEHRQPPLKPSTDYYSLYLAEETGDIDIDLPPMDVNESISRFSGISCVALVENEDPVRRACNDPIFVKIIFVDGTFTTILVNSMEILLREVFEKALRKRSPQKVLRGMDYNLEKKSDPGVPLNLEMSLSQAKSLEFYLVRENSKNPILSVPSGESKKKDVPHDCNE